MVIILMCSCRTKKLDYNDLISEFEGTIYLKDFDKSYGSNFKGHNEIIDEAIKVLQSLGGGVLKFEKNKQYKLTSPVQIPFSNITVNLNGAVIDGRSIQSESSVFILSGNKPEIVSTKILGKKGGKYIDKKVLRYNNGILRISNNKLLQRSRKYYTKSEFVKYEIDGDYGYLDSLLIEYGEIYQIEEIKFIENSKIMNGTILCNSTIKNTGVKLENARNCSIERIKVIDASIAGIQIDKGVQCKVDSCTVISKNVANIGFNYGVLFTNSQNCYVKNSYCETLRTGIDQSLSHFILIEGNELVNCGISPHAGSKITIKNNVINGGSIYLRSYDSEVIGNKISAFGKGLGGIILAEIEGKGNIKIVGNEINFTGKDEYKKSKGVSHRIGVYSALKGLSNIEVKENIIRNADRGIYIFTSDNHGGNTGVAIGENQILNYKDIGVAVYRYSNVKISNNKIVGKTKNGTGVHMWASGNSFNNISVFDNTMINAKKGISISRHYKLKKVINNTVQN